MSVTNTVGTIHRFLRYIGLAPYSTYKVPSKYELLYSTCTYLIHLVFSLTHAGNKFFTEYYCFRNTDIVDSIHYTSHVYFPLFDTASYFAVIFNNYKVRRVLKEIQNCDYSLSTIGCTPPYRREYKFQVTSVTTSCCMFIFGVFLSLYGGGDRELIVVAKYPLNIGLYLAVFTEFCILAYILLQRFLVINMELEKLGKSLDSMDLSRVDSLKMLENKLAVLSHVHVKLQSAVNLLESYFSLQYLLAVIMISWRTIVVILTFLSQNYRIENTCIYYLLWDKENLVIVTVFYWLYISAEICSCLTKEANCSAVEVHLMQRRSLPLSVLEHIETFSIGILIKPVAFADCGLFTMNRTLFTKMAVIIITLTVMLLQTADVQSGTEDNSTNATLH